MIDLNYAQVEIGAGYGSPSPSFYQRFYRPFYWAKTIWCIHPVKPPGGVLFSDISTFYKSVDGGYTWVKSKELPNPADTSKRLNVWVAQVNEYLHVLQYDETNTLTIMRFNCNVQDFDATWTSVGVPSTFAPADFFARTDGKFVVCGTSGATLQYIIVDPAADPVWGPMTEIPIPFTLYGAVFCLGAEDRLHVIVVEHLLVNKIWHMNVAADGTAAGIQVVDTDFGFEYFSNMVPFKIGSDTYIMIWGRYRGDEEFTMRAASLHAKSEAAPTWVKTDTYIPPQNATYDLTSMGNQVIAVSYTSDFAGAEYLLFDQNKWSPRGVIFWHDNAKTFFYPHGNNLNGELGVVFRSNDVFYHFLVPPADPADACWQQVRLPELPQMNTQTPPYDPKQFENYFGIPYYSNSGPWRAANGDLYVLGMQQMTWNVWMHVFRSKNNGRTWQPMDAANSFVSKGAVFYDKAKEVLTVVHDYWGEEDPSYPPANGRTLAFKDFDLATNKWKPRYGYPPVSLKWLDLMDVFVKPNGDKIVLFQSESGTELPGGGTLLGYLLYYIRWNATSGWSAPVLYSDTHPWTTDTWVEYRGAALHPETGDIHLVWMYSDDYDQPNIFYHRILKNDMTMTTPHELAVKTDPFADEGPNTPTCQPILFFKDKVCVLFNQGWTGGYSQPVKGYYYMMVGDPVEAPATWTERRVATLPLQNRQGTQQEDMDIAAVVKGGKLIFIWQARTGPCGHETDIAAAPISMQLFKTETTDTVGYSMPELFFDFWPSDEPIFGLTLNDIGSGMADGIGIFGSFYSAVACGLYKCRGGAAGNYAF